MRKILQKIAWKTHRWGFKYSSFILYLGAEHNKFGFQIMNIKNGITWEGSLFEWDRWCTHMDDLELWGTKLTRWEKFNIYINDKFNSIG